MVLSDALSRRPDLCPEEDNDNSDVIVLPKHLFVNLIDVDLKKRIANANELDTDMGMFCKPFWAMDPLHYEMTSQTGLPRSLMANKFFSLKAKTISQRILPCDAT